MNEGIVALLIPLSAVILGLGLAALGLYFRHQRQQLFHRERMAAIEKNLQLPENFFQEPAGDPKTFLLRGLIWLFAGIGLAAFFVALWFADRGEKELLALASLGLIPVGVGVAYLIVYRREGSKDVQQAGS